MAALLVRRLISTVPVLFLVSLIVFSLVLLIPGDPAITLAGDNATEAQVDETRERLGLNDPVVEQYGRWVSGAVRGDLGTSLFSSQEVLDAVGQRFPTTLSLALGATLFAVAVGVPFGIIAALRRGRPTDRMLTIGTSLGVATPNYFLGMLLVLGFSIWLPWLPATGYVAFTEDPVLWAKHLVLPCITLGTVPAAVVTRQLRSSLADVLQLDYVRTANSKGLRPHVVVIKHALKNASGPVVTVLGLQLAFLLGGTVLIEQVFNLPGIGQLAVTSVIARDIPMIQGVVVVTTLIVVATNLVVDISYGWLNPRSRTS